MFSVGKAESIGAQRIQMRTSIIYLKCIVKKTIVHDVFLLSDWHKLEVSACGNKLLSIALKQANIYLVTKSAAYNWDLCAAHAIIRSIGGRIVDLPRLKAFFDQHRSLANIDLSQFEIIYNDKLGNLHFQPKDYACSPFIAYFNRSDLVDILEYFLINNILIE